MPQIKIKVGGTTNAGIGDQITIEGTVDGIFNDTSVLFELIDTGEDIRDPDNTVDDDEVTVVKANTPLAGLSKEFQARTILDDGGKLSFKFNVTEDIKREAAAEYKPDKVEKGDLLAVDNMMVRVRARVTDKAGNSTPQANM